MSEHLRKYVRTVPHFPKKGIMFIDITTLLNHPEAFKETIDILHRKYADAEIDKVVGIESRGFIIGAPLAYKLGKGFALIRKRGKLPYKKIIREYELEYGKDAIEMHSDSIKKGEKVLLVDDLLATGGTAKAAAELVEDVGGIIHSIAFVIELPDLHGRKKLKKYNITSLISFEGE